MFQYQSSAFVLPDDYTQHFTIDQAAVQITRDDDSWSLTLGQAYTVTAAFRVSDATYDNNGVSGFHEFSPAQIDAANLSMQGWSDVANITFQRVGTGDSGPPAYSDNAQVLFGDYTTGAEGAAAFTYLPRQGAWAGDVWVNSTQPDNQSPTLWSYGQMTLTHEIGHSIGMEHPGDYDASDSQDPSYYSDAVYAEDTYQYSVMSYFSETNTGGNYNEYYPSAPQLDDIAAAQRLYGANMTTRTGDTVYGFHSNADRPWFIATDASSPLIFSVWDAGGHDTFDFSGYAVGSLINLNAGTFSDVGGLRGNVSIAEGVTIEDATGGAGDDNIFGNAADNLLIGGDGNDNLHGGDGNDTLIGGSGVNVLDGGNGYDIGDYSGSSAACSFTDPGTDGLEEIIGSGFRDNFQLMDNTYQIVHGGGGDDIFYYSELATPVTIDGGDGSDTVQLIDFQGHGYTVAVGDFVSVENLTGGEGDDVLIGDSGSNVLIGGDGNDTLIGGGGADSLDGGNNGYDTVSFADSNAPVQIDLVNLTASAGGVVSVLNHIEGAIGSTFDDQIWSDVIRGALSGGAGDDVVHLSGWYPDVGQTIDGGAGSDVLDLSSADATVTFDLSKATEQVISVEEIIGSRFSDMLTGDHLANTLIGGGGNDLLAGGQGDDRLDGGAGKDTLSYEHAANGVAVNLTEGTGGGGAEGADVVVSFETVIGSSYDDTLVGSAGADSLSGGDGADLLCWSGGKDTLDGGGIVSPGGAGDTVSFADSPDAVWINLDAGLATSSGDQIKLIDIYGVIGSAFDDEIAVSSRHGKLSGGDGDDVFHLSAVPDATGGVDGGAGKDTVDFTHATDPIVVDLAASTSSLTGIEEVIAGRFNDAVSGDGYANTLIGASGWDTLQGGGGDDRLDGGDGDDTVSYADATNGVIANLALGTGGGGAEGTDVMVSVENLVGSAFDDTLTGSAGVNSLSGGGGADVLCWSGGKDWLDGGGWDDLGELGDTASFAASPYAVRVDLDQHRAVAGPEAVTLVYIFGVIGSAFADDITAGKTHGILSGGGGNDVFHLAAPPSAAASAIDGGAGDDTVDFSQSAAALSIDLAASGTTLVSVERIIGGALADTLTGDRLANTLAGGAGDDTLAGAQGNDRLDGGDGDDTVTYAGASHGVLVNLLHGTGGGAAAGADILVSIETLVGSSFDDIMTGGVGANSLSGGGGDDVLTWSGGADTLDGGAGTDTANFSGYTHAIQSTAADTVLADATDTLVSIERLVGTSFNDTLTAGVAQEALIGGDGRDTFIASKLGGSFAGGAQIDTLVADGAGLTVDLTTGSGVTGDAGALAFSVSSIEAVDGGVGADVVTGDDRADLLSGEGGGDVLSGEAGRDRLDGGNGADTLTGGLGADVLTGGTGADRFIYDSLHDSGGRGATDLITDLASADVIDLGLIDANTGVAGDQAFVEVQRFDHHAGELVLSYSAKTGVTRLMLDVNGDGKADMIVKLDGDHSDFTHFVL